MIQTCHHLLVGVSQRRSYLHFFKNFHLFWQASTSRTEILPLPVLLKYATMVLYVKFRVPVGFDIEDTGFLFKWTM